MSAWVDIFYQMHTEDGWRDMPHLCEHYAFGLNGWLLGMGKVDITPIKPPRGLPSDFEMVYYQEPDDLDYSSFPDDAVYGVPAGLRDSAGEDGEYGGYHPVTDPEIIAIHQNYDSCNNVLLPGKLLVSIGSGPYTWLLDDEILNAPLPASLHEDEALHAFVDEIRRLKERYGHIRITCGTNN